MGTAGYPLLPAPFDDMIDVQKEDGEQGGYTEHDYNEDCHKRTEIFTQVIMWNDTE